VFIIAFYYVNTHLIIPKLLDHKKFLTYTLIILALLIFYGLLPRIYHGLFGYLQPPPPGPGMRPNQIRNHPLVSSSNIAIFLLVFVFSTGIKVINEWLRSEQRNKEIAHEKLQAELSFLKAQINPHFLFNTLNNIYALASDQSEHTAPAIMKLSSIMRYVLTEARNDLAPLEKEILFTSHYIELQKMRLTDKTSIDFTIQGDPLGRQIAPLLLLPFVENAFKYGISTREWSPIRILLDIKKDSLYFSISNQKHLNTSLRMADNTGIGISNTRRRLDLLYEDRYKLLIEDKTGEFSVHLNISV
jgi:two-component system LytT family sensor kinase